MSVDDHTSFFCIRQHDSCIHSIVPGPTRNYYLMMNGRILRGSQPNVFPQRKQHSIRLAENSINMHKIPFVILIFLLPTIVFAQQGVSFGIQSNYGVGRLTLESAPRTVTVTPNNSFVTGGSLFVQWNITNRFGVRFQADGLYQGMNIAIVNPADRVGTFGVNVEDFGQGAGNLQISYNQPLNSSRSLRLEGYIGAGARVTNEGTNGCGTSIGGIIAQDDSLGNVTVDASRTIGNGTQVEVLGGFRFVQQVNSSEKNPIFLSFGIGYRQTLSPISRVEGIAYSDEVPVIINQFGFAEFQVEEIQGICQTGGFDTRPEDRYVLQHLGQQVDMQIGIRLGL